MLTIMFLITMIYVTWMMFVWGLKVTWNIMKFVCMVILLPVFLVALVFIGFGYLVIPILIIVEIAVIISRFTTA